MTTEHFTLTRPGLFVFDMNKVDGIIIVNYYDGDGKYKSSVVHVADLIAWGRCKYWFPVLEDSETLTVGEINERGAKHFISNINSHQIEQYLSHAQTNTD